MVGRSLRRSPRRRSCSCCGRRDVAVPVAVYPWSWPSGELDVPWDEWVWVSAVSLAPFAVLASLRVGVVMTRVAALVALVPCGALVWQGERGGLDTTGRSLFGALLLIVGPIFAFIAIGVVLCVDLLVKGALGAKARRRESLRIRS